MDTFRSTRFLIIAENKMSEKRLIDIDELMYIAFKAENRNDIEEEFNNLPRPTLADVCGTRKLNSMTRSEVKELLELDERIKVSMWDTKRISDDEIECYANWNDILYPDLSENSTFQISMGYLSKFHRVITNPKIFKWFLEKGFNVLGDI